MSAEWGETASLSSECPQPNRSRSEGLRFVDVGIPTALPAGKM